MSIEEQSVRRHVFELLPTELRVYTGEEVQCFRITPEQMMKLMFQSSHILFSHFDVTWRR